MTTHLSTRLAWNDRAWDGCVCDEPHLNASCIVLKHIREGRDDEKERRVAGKALSELFGDMPLCSRDTGAYSPHGYKVEHHDPLEFRRLKPITEEIPPYSCCPSPYRWMREDFFQDVCQSEGLAIRGPDEAKDAGWVMEPDRQSELLKNFWQKLEPKRSLIFYYCNQGNPVDENTTRLIVGVGRIAEIGEQLYFGATTRYPDAYPLWTRSITQDYPAQGVRIPYHEYIKAGLPMQDILCRVPRNAMLPFSYVGEHVSDDVAVAILERIIQAIEQVRADSLVAGDWDERLAWLNDVLAETWSGRGPFPGIGSVLQYLGCETGTAYQRAVLAPMAKNGENPWDYVQSILEGRSEPEPGPHRNGLLRARQRWSVISSRWTLLAKLARFELSPDQVERIADPDRRVKCGITANEREITANPYILAENDLGTSKSERIALETIDHGMRPEGDAALFPDEDHVTQDDRRRVRAVAQAALQEAADAGDTVMVFSDLLELITKRFPDKRACNPDREVMMADVDFHKEIMWTAFDADPPLVSLDKLRGLEHHVASVIRRRATKTNDHSGNPADWRGALEALFGAPTSDREEAALTEKEQALKTLYSRRLSVLTGGAGTGKTSVLKVFINELERIEGKQPILLLAPTGKARVRLSTKTQRNAMTIHQLLLKQEWLMPDVFALKSESNKELYKAVTVVIDESSMIPVDLLGTLLKALDMGPLSRLIFVGDPNQLPPIGPGRPFVDMVDWLNREHPECIAPLRVWMRTDEEEGKPAEQSVALALADGYRADVENPGDDEVLAAVAKGESSGDLDVVFWSDHHDLTEKLKAKMKDLLGFGDKDYTGLNRSLGIDTGEWNVVQSEAWQILSPTRGHHFGTDDINRLIQSEYRGGMMHKAKTSPGLPKPFGDYGIVYTDKVIQIMNRSMSSWPKGQGLDYVANGEIGLVKRTTKGNDYLDVGFSTQPDVTYRYFRSKVNENLELAYALTVHKAQGSDFDVVFLVIPQSASTLSRELIYTGLTRFRKRLVLLIEKDIAPLLNLRSLKLSDTRLRSTQMFTLILRPDTVSRPYTEALIHRTRKGVLVRSKSEVVVADILQSLGISYEYEQPLYSRTDSKDFRLPDFTVSFEGDIYYWEHLGMLSIPTYREAWERKLAWYEANGFAGKLITSEDGLNGSIDASEIENTARTRILGE